MQIPVSLGDIDKTPFSIGPGKGIYIFRVMPFGIHNAAACCQRLVDGIFSDVPFVACYIDDIVSFSDTCEDHMIHLDQTVRKVSAAGLKIKPSKCTLGENVILFLGNNINQTGVKPDPGKTEGFRRWEKPTCVADIQCFWVFFVYYHKFIQNFVEKASPLYDLLKDKSEFVWDTKHEEAFEKLKIKLSELPTLRFILKNQPLIIRTDASGNAIDSILF